MGSCAWGRKVFPEHILEFYALWRQVLLRHPPVRWSPVSGSFVWPAVMSLFVFTRPLYPPESVLWRPADVEHALYVVDIVPVVVLLELLL